MNFVYRGDSFPNILKLLFTDPPHPRRINRKRKLKARRHRKLVAQQRRSMAA